VSHLAREHGNLHAPEVPELTEQVGSRHLVHGEIIDLVDRVSIQVELEDLSRLAAAIDRVQDDDPRRLFP
jgi:hypothetical protein